MNTIWNLTKKLLPICALFLVCGVSVVLIPQSSMLRFAEFWDSASLIFKVVKAGVILLLVLKWSECCRWVCERKGKPEAAEQLAKQWPLFFSVILVIELVGVWRDFH